uniref:hypothetical protein n=1 Tax=Salmonella sp. SAL4435 TaxID=3159890 RepID=UPI003978F93C
IGDKLLKNEREAIDTFVTRAELIHDITATLVTLPAGGSLGMGGTKAVAWANAVPGRSAAWTAATRPGIAVIKAVKGIGSSGVVVKTSEKAIE